MSTITEDGNRIIIRLPVLDEEQLLDGDGEEWTCTIGQHKYSKLPECRKEAVGRPVWGPEVHACEGLRPQQWCSEHCDYQLGREAQCTIWQCSTCGSQLPDTRLLRIDPLR